MDYSANDVFQFIHYFSGNERFYGVTQLLNKVDDKVQVNSFLKHEPPTSNIYMRHLNGIEGMGISPLRDDDTVRFGAIDIDNFEGDLNDIVRAVVDFNLPLLPCQSKSGKLHLYIFFSEDTSSLDCIRILQQYRMMFGLSSKVEIFPKQTHITDSSYPSWINLPYFGDTRKTLYPEPISFREAVEKIGDIIHTVREHDQFLETLWFVDAPPCLCSGILLRDLERGERNTWMFSLGVFLQFKELNCDEYLNTVNNSMMYPLSNEEIQNTINGLQKKTYFYPCKQLQRCDKNCCRKQKYGYNYRLGSGLSYGVLTQYLVDPPYYEWEINGQPLVFYTESELLSQSKFRELCLRQLHVVPRPLPNAQWSEVVNKACENIKIKISDSPQDDLSYGTLFNNIIQSYFIATRLADRVEDVKYNRIYKNEGSVYIYFSVTQLYRYITETMDFKLYSPSEVRKRLISDFEAIPPKPNEKLWKIQIELLPGENLGKELNDQDSESSLDQEEIVENVDEGDIRF